MRPNPVASPERAPVSAYVAVGANLGDPVAAVSAALNALSQLPDTHTVAVSGLYRSAPHQAQGPSFVNAVAHLHTRLNAPDLLEALQAMEQQAGRVRSVLNAPRTLDLDILFYGHCRMQSCFLTLPHPRWMERAFVLLPLQELAPHLVIPAMLRAVTDQPIKKIG